MYSKALKMIRLYFGLNQITLAKKVGFAVSYISSIEIGITSPSMNVLTAYAEFLDVPLSSLIAFCEALEQPSHMPLPIHKKVLRMLDWVRDTQGE